MILFCNLALKSGGSGEEAHGIRGREMLNGAEESEGKMAERENGTERQEGMYDDGRLSEIEQGEGRKVGRDCRR